MRYKLGKSIEAIKDKEEIQAGEGVVEILTSKEYEMCHQQKTSGRMTVESIQHAKYCRVDILKDSIVSVLVIPKKEHLLEGGEKIAAYMTTEKLVFVDDHGLVKKAAEDLLGEHISSEISVSHFFVEFLEYVLREDVIFLQQYEEHLSKLEELLLKGGVKDFDRKILKTRKEILRLQTYYEQMIDLIDTLEENQNRQFDEEACRLFALFSRRVDRLYDNTRMLKEYSLQLREMYDSQLGNRQNEIMKVLTVVTTIFMPLTLIAGWYGMNFVNMPELRNPNGYIVIIGVSVITILIEIWIFRIKKWF